MKKVIFFCFILFATEAFSKQTICLNMIVKNESHVIKRCLESTLPIIDCWVIVDTGSTDGTQEIIKEYLKDIPGELHERPWVNFGHNREEALKLAKDKADYILFMDADDKLSFSPKFKLPELTEDFYFVPTHFNGVECSIPRLIKSSMDWHWHGVLHEYILADGDLKGAKLENVEYIYISDGARSKNPNRYKDDIRILEEDLKKNPNNARDVFYLATTYLTAKDWKNALTYYQKRAEMGGLPEETFVSKLNIARMQEKLGEEPKTVAKSYLEAYKNRPGRIEPLFYFVQQARVHSQFQKGYDIASLALLFKSNDILFVEKWIYDYGMLFEYAICACGAQKYLECEAACKQLLAMKNLPKEVKDETLKLVSILRALKIEPIQQQIIQFLDKTT